MTSFDTRNTVVVNVLFYFFFQIKEKLTEFADFELQLKEAISHFNSVLESKSVTSLSEVYLHIEPKYESDTYRTFSQRVEKVIWQNWFHFLKKVLFEKL